MTNKSSKRVKARDLAREYISSFPIENGDVILVKRDDAMFDPLKVFNSLRTALAANGYDKCMVIITGDDRDIRTLNREDMLGYGWKWAGKPDEDGVSA